MVNEQKNIQEPEFEEVGRLLGSLKRVEAPKDFDFHVRARIAKGRPAEARRSWLPASLVYGAPLALVLVVGGYVGYRTTSTVEQAGGPAAAAPTASAPQSAAPSASDVATNPSRISEVPSDQTLAGTKMPDAANKATKTAQKTPVTADQKTEKPGGSYDEAARDSVTIRQPDVDDNEPAPPKKAIVPVNQFLSSAGVSTSGSTIVSVSGAATRAGLKAGDIIQAVNVQTGTVRVSRDGKTVSVLIR
jgi:hypothetical protein